MCKLDDILVQSVCFQEGENVDVICCLKGHIDSEYFLLPVGYSCQ